MSGPYIRYYQRSLSKWPTFARFAICNVPLCMPWTIFILKVMKMRRVNLFKLCCNIYVRFDLKVFCLLSYIYSGGH